MNSTLHWLDNLGCSKQAYEWQNGIVSLIISLLPNMKHVKKKCSASTVTHSQFYENVKLSSTTNKTHHAPLVACLVHCSRSTYGQLTLIPQAPVSSPLPEAGRSDKIPSRIPPHFYVSSWLPDQKMYNSISRYVGIGGKMWISWQDPML